MATVRSLVGIAVVRRWPQEARIDEMPLNIRKRHYRLAQRRWRVFGLYWRTLCGVQFYLFTLVSKWHNKKRKWLKPTSLHHNRPASINIPNSFWGYDFHRLATRRVLHFYQISNSKNTWMNECALEKSFQIAVHLYKERDLRWALKKMHYIPNIN